MCAACGAGGVQRPELLFPQSQPHGVVIDVERILVMRIALAKPSVVIDAAQGLAAIGEEIQLKPL